MSVPSKVCNSLLLGAVLVALVLPASTAAGGGITVFAAASLNDVFPRIDKAPRINIQIGFESSILR